MLSEAVLPFGTSEVTASMVLSTIDPELVEGEHLDKWRLRKKMSRARWGEAKFPKGNMASETLSKSNVDFKDGWQAIIF